MSLILNKTEAVRYEVEIPEELNKYYKDKVFPFLRKFSKLVHRWLVEGRLQGINDKQFLFSDDIPDMYGTEKGKLPEHRSLDDGRIKSDNAIFGIPSAFLLCCLNVKNLSRTLLEFSLS